jgi:hypothetical protein
MSCLVSYHEILCDKSVTYKRNKANKETAQEVKLSLWVLILFVCFENTLNFSKLQLTIIGNSKRTFMIGKCFQPGQKKG